MKKKIIVSIVLTLFIIVGYFIIDSTKITNYESAMDEILNGETVESINIFDAKNPEQTYLEVTDQETIEKIITKPGKTKIKEIDDYPIDEYYLSVKTNKKDFRLIVGRNNIIRFVGFEEGSGGRFYEIEGDNPVLPVLDEIINK